MKKLSLKQLSVISAVVFAVAVALRLISLFLYHEPSGYYKSGAPLPIISNVFFALSVVFILVASIALLDKKRTVAPPSSLCRYIALLPMSAAIFHLFRILLGVYNDTAVKKPLMVIGCLLCAAFFFMVFFKSAPNTASVYLGIGALFYVFLNWVFVYFDFSSPLNSIDKIFFCLACAGVLLFVFGEICACYRAVKPRLYVFSTLCAILTVAVSSLTSLIAHQGFQSYIWLEADIFFVCVAVYASARLISLIKAEKTEIQRESTNENPEETPDENTDENTEETTEKNEKCE